MHAATGTFTGVIQASTGTFAGVIQAATGTFTGSVTTASLIATGGHIDIATDSANTSVIHLEYGNAYNEMAPGYSEVGDDTQASHVFAGSVESPTVEGERVYATSYFQCNGNGKVLGDFEATGVKARCVETKTYGNIVLYAYETASPYFGDIGTGSTDENVNCFVYFDNKFSETIENEYEYVAFIQKEGNGDLWVSEKTPIGFMVCGTQNLDFAWEVKAKQKGQAYRMERSSEIPEQSLDYEYILNRYRKDLTVDYESILTQLVYEERERILSC